MIRNFRESFSFKVFISFSGSILILLGVFAPFIVYQQSRAVKQHLLGEGKMLADLLANSTRTWVFAENRALLKEAVQGVMSQKDVLSVSIFNADGNPLYSEKKMALGKKDGKEYGGAFTAGKGDPPDIEEDEDAIAFYTPVVLETSEGMEESLYFDVAPGKKTQTTIGYVKVVLDKGAMTQKIKSVLIESAFITAIFVTLGAFVIYLSIKRVTRPLDHLTEAVKHLGRGESVEKVPVHSMDEIGRLASTFNAMSEDLKKREEEKALLEEKLRHAQKMEAIGTFARGIAHDFNNILTTVQGSLYILEKKLREESYLRSYTGQIRNSIDKAKGLIQSLLTFSRIQKTNLCPLDLRDLIRKLKPHLSTITGEKIGLEVSLPVGPLNIMADGTQIEQLLINLCENSRDAMPDGGLLVIASGPAPVGPGCSKVNLTPGGYALITISDNGTGMDGETKERMFEPFFTTKEVGKGTGLGLSIVYGIIEQHNGCIEVDTVKGEGTAFRIYLPMIENNKINQEASGKV